MKALIMLEDGWHQFCESFTGVGEVFGEIIFNTSLTGYQEVITDPSYRRQIVVMTQSMMGTYGIRENESESRAIFASGMVVREYAGVSAVEDGRYYSDLYPVVSRNNSETLRDSEIGVWEDDDFSGESKKYKDAISGSRIDRNIKHSAVNNKITDTLGDFLKNRGIMGVEGVDTRALTRHIRDRGAMRAGISTITLEPEELRKKVLASPSIVGRDLVKEVTTHNEYLFSEGERCRIAVIDCGVKLGILQQLALRDVRVEVFPSDVTKKDILKSRPDGVLFSNGPGDPAALPYLVELADSLLGEFPVFGICLGHQIMSQAFGAKTYKLKFGHHGGNHPVRDENTKKIYITTQNHGFAVDPESFGSKNCRVNFINLNDHTVEGFYCEDVPILSVQFHPEAAPGPHDTQFLFDNFINMVCRKNA